MSTQIPVSLTTIEDVRAQADASLRGRVLLIELVMGGCGPGKDAARMVVQTEDARVLTTALPIDILSQVLEMHRQVRGN